MLTVHYGTNRRVRIVAPCRYDLVIQEQKQRYRDIYERPGTRIVVYDASTTDLGDYDSKNPLHVILKSLCTIGDKECGYLLGTSPLLVNGDGDAIFLWS